MIDLHIHSCFSDGTMLPEDIIEFADKRRFKAIAITDHDTASGLDRARSATHGRDLQFIPGIELSVTHSPGELHILGLGLKDWSNSGLLKEINEKRDYRNNKTVQLLNEAGYPVKISELRKYTKGTLGRPHFARWLTENGYSKSIRQAFDLYLGRGKEFYIKRDTVELQEAIAFIHERGGLAVAAHPLHIPVGFTELTGKIESWIRAGIDGVEALHSGSRNNLLRRLQSFCLENNIMMTGGTDFHGKNKPGIKMGRIRGWGPVTDNFLPVFPE